jgi:hypothetical protein
MPGFLRAREKFLGPFLVVVFFLLNLSIASRSPFGGRMDEVSYADLGLNLAAGKGWTSTAFSWQTDREFFAGTPPLYAAGLALWSKVMGISMVSARAYCYFLAAIGMFLLWLGTYRFNLLTPAYRLFWIVFLSTEYAMNWMERNQRYDVWIFAGLATAWCGASLRAPGPRYALLFAGCFLIPFAGLIGGPYVFLLAGLAMVLTQFKFWKEGLIAMAGAGLGVLGLNVFFLAFGRLGAFWACVPHMTAGEQSHWQHPIFLYPQDDWGIALMIVLLIILSIYHGKQRTPGFLAWAALGGGIVVLVPCMMLMRGVFWMFYFYMVIIPLSLAILELARMAGLTQRGVNLARGAAVVMGALCLTGLPSRLYASVKEWDFRDPQHMQDFVRMYVRPDDAVFSDYQFYFVLRDKVKFIAVPFYYVCIPPDEAARIDVALVCDADMPDLTRDISKFSKIGGGWKKVAVFPTAEMLAGPGGRIAHQNFTLYRRETGPAQQ